MRTSPESARSSRRGTSRSTNTLAPDAVVSDGPACEGPTDCSKFSAKRRRGGGDPSRLMVPQSASLERETRFAAGSQHTTTRHEAPAPMTAAPIGSPNRFHRAWHEPRASQSSSGPPLGGTPRRQSRAIAPKEGRLRRETMWFPSVRVPAEADAEWRPPRTGFRARRTCSCGTRRRGRSALPPPGAKQTS